MPLMNLNLIFDGHYDEGVGGPACKRASSNAGPSLKFHSARECLKRLNSSSETTQAQIQALRRTKRLNRPAQTSRPQQLTVDNKVRTTRTVPFDTLAPPTGANGRRLENCLSCCETFENSECHLAPEKAQKNHPLSSSSVPPSRSQRRSTDPLSAALPTEQKSGSWGLFGAQFSPCKVGHNACHTSVSVVLIFHNIFALVLPLG